MDAAVHPVVAQVLAVGAGRLGATVAAVVSLFAVALGVVAVARPGPPGRTTVVLALGALGLVLGAAFVATADGGLGSGNGLGGAVVAVALGVVGLLLGTVGRLRLPSRA